MFETLFMGWVDHLPEVGDPIRTERSKLLELARQATELERSALEMRAHVLAGQAELLAKVMQHWTPADTERARDQADKIGGSARLNAVLLCQLQDAPLFEQLCRLDGMHLAAEALRAFSDGGVIGQHNLLSTATDAERRATLARVLAWWNVAGVPVYDRLSAGPGRSLNDADEAAGPASGEGA